MHFPFARLLRLLRWFLLPFLFLPSSSCQQATQVTLQPCSLPPDTLQALKASDKWLGCMVSFWKRQDVSEALFRPVVLLKEGTLSLRPSPSAPQDVGFRLSLPRSAVNDPSGLIFRIYLLPQAKSKALDAAPFEEHLTLCREMSSATYDCFSPNRAEVCWLSLNVQPVASSEDIKIYSLGLPSNEACQVCQREICGDKKDNNCNNQIDEYDEIGGLRTPCQGAPEAVTETSVEGASEGSAENPPEDASSPSEGTPDSP